MTRTTALGPHGNIGVRLVTRAARVASAGRRVTAMDGLGRLRKQVQDCRDAGAGYEA
jgi:hypothetical protein